jgi:hypothetical protein
MKLRPCRAASARPLAKELGKARAMANILAAQSVEMRANGEAMIQQPARLLCESWNQRMWSDGEPMDPSPSIGQTVNGGFALAGDQVRALQDAERPQPRGDEPPADQCTISPAGCAAANAPRQAGVDPRLCYNCLAAAPPTNRSRPMCNLYYADLRIMPRRCTFPRRDDEQQFRVSA